MMLKIYQWKDRDYKEGGQLIKKTNVTTNHHTVATVDNARTNTHTCVQIVLRVAIARD